MDPSNNDLVMYEEDVFLPQICGKDVDRFTDLCDGLERNLSSKMLSLQLECLNKIELTVILENVKITDKSDVFHSCGINYGWAEILTIILLLMPYILTLFLYVYNACIDLYSVLQTQEKSNEETDITSK
ncbi:hypothetical protein GJ496_005065 [Pomphorhynchus laevis]|nr:hypothetical protein GJ496_005065 [Pomphorhynchus laevis]